MPLQKVNLYFDLIGDWSPPIGEKMTDSFVVFAFAAPCQAVRRIFDFWLTDYDGRLPVSKLGTD